jgi:hypothetical protein
MHKNERLVLVGDNPFHGISHVSQERAAMRGKDVLTPLSATNIVSTALDYGADAFTFTVSDTTLEILKQLKKRGRVPQLYAIVPYAYEYVRLAVALGGIPGLGKRIAKQIIKSGNLSAAWHGIRGILTIDPAEAYKAYVAFEVSRIRAYAGKGSLKCLFLHCVVADMALGLDMDWLFKAHISILESYGIKPGFHTHNFPLFIDRVKKWDIDLDRILITTPFNAIGMQMNPGRQECEKTLRAMPCNNVMVFGVLAGGLLQVDAAIEYIKALPHIYGVAFGVSTTEQAKKTFSMISCQ